VAFDSSRVQKVAEHQYVIWLQTQWTVPRHGSRRRTSLAFNREIIHSFLRCNPTGYKVASTVVSLNDGPPVDSVAVGLDAARKSQWSEPAANSVDAIAGAAVCAMLSG
jgi:hypothetical protein